MNSSKNCSVIPKRHAGRGISLIIPVALFLFACNSADEKTAFRQMQNEVAEQTASATGVTGNDTVNGVIRQFRKEADIKMKVKDVHRTVEDIGKLTVSTGGFIEEKNIHSDRLFSRETRVKQDSVLCETFYTVNGEVTLRIPVQHLDSVTAAVTGLASFIDHSKLLAEDMKLQLYASVLSERRNNRHAEMLSGTESVSDTKNTVLAKEKALLSQEAADNSRIEGLSLADEINYSSVKIALYQERSVHHELLASPQAPAQFHPSFFKSAALAFDSGWEMLKKFVLILFNSWSILLLLFLIFIGIRKIMKLSAGAA